MLEIILELAEMNTLYALYTGILLGLTLKYFWTWNLDCYSSTSDSYYIDENRIHSPTIVLNKHRSQSNLLFNWIIQIVRRKETSSDATDHFVFLLYH